MFHGWNWSKGINKSIKDLTIIEIENSTNNWDMNHFEMWLGDYDNWLNNIKSLRNRDIIKSATKIINHPDISNLNFYKII